MRWITTFFSYAILGSIVGAVFFPFGVIRKSDIDRNIITCTMIGAIGGMIHAELNRTIRKR